MTYRLSDKREDNRRGLKAAEPIAGNSRDL